MSNQEQQQEALSRATTGQSLSNYPAIFEGFAEKGIPEDQIQPRENVFTFQAWKALGRVVCKGEHGVRVETWINYPERVTKSGEKKKAGKRRKVTTVFHLSQTKPLEEKEAS